MEPKKCIKCKISFNGKKTENFLKNQNFDEDIIF